MDLRNRESFIDDIINLPFLVYEQGIFSGYRLWTSVQLVICGALVPYFNTETHLCYCVLATRLAIFIISGQPWQWEGLICNKLDFFKRGSMKWYVNYRWWKFHIKSHLCICMLTTRLTIFDFQLFVLNICG